jgi:hypothetical protein
MNYEFNIFATKKQMKYVHNMNLEYVFPLKLHKCTKHTPCCIVGFV